MDILALCRKSRSLKKEETSLALQTRCFVAMTQSILTSFFLQLPLSVLSPVSRIQYACGKFLLPGIRSGLLIAVLAHAHAGLYPLDFSWSTIKLLLKVMQSPSFPSQGRSGRDLCGSLAICLAS